MQKTQVIEKQRREFKLELLLKIAELPSATFCYHMKRSKQADKYAAEKEMITAIYHENKGRMGTAALRRNCVNVDLCETARQYSS